MDRRRRRGLSCLKCKATFTRIDHLTRHEKSHEAKKQYQCPCGSQFSRNDVLARHIKQCPQGRHQGIPFSQPKQTRSKKACNRCAASKLKCDSQAPCHNCEIKSQSCQYTRAGYADPYLSYRIAKDQQENLESTSDVNLELSRPTLPSRTRSHYQDTTVPDGGGHISSLITSPTTNEPDIAEEMDYDNGNAHCSDSVTWDLSLDYNHLLTPLDESDLNQPGIDSNGTQQVLSVTSDEQMLSSLNQLDFDSMFMDLPTLDTSNSPRLELSGPDNSSFAYEREPYLSADGFLLRQLDPVEAKCVELRHLVQISLDGPSDASFISRGNLIKFTELFAKHFSSNVPVVHLPSFSLIDTSPILLVSIMLVGACYCSEIPAPTIHDYTIKLLNFIENQPHEREMERPPLFIIQASVMLCTVLVCAQDQKSFRFVTMYHARNISMAERAGLFENTDVKDYSSMTEREFDWPHWIEQETRRRLGCQIFCHDVGRCIFMKRPPSLNPLMMDFELPHYQRCWKASTAAGCLHYLQQFPCQPKLSDAVRLVRSTDLNTRSLTNTSTLGMFVVIIALHGLVFQVSQRDTNVSLDERLNALTAFKHTGATSSVLGCPLSSTVNDMVARFGSEPVKQINHALNKWRSSWDLRGPHDHEHEQYTFSGDPMRFWWLAKLYLLNGVHQQQAVDGAVQSALITPAASNDAQNRLNFQSRILSWLLQCRQEGSIMESSSHGSILCRIMKRADVATI